MKLPRLNITVDEQNVFIKQKKAAKILIKAILIWCLIASAYEIYSMLKK